MNKHLQQPRSLIIASAILAIALLCVILFLGATPTTRGPIEILSALLLGAIALLFRAYALRSRQ